MGLLDKLSRKRKEKSIEEKEEAEKAAEKFVKLFNESKEMRNAFTTLSDLYGGEVIGYLTTPILDAFFDPSLGLHVISSVAPWVDERSFHHFYCPALAEGGKVSFPDKKQVSKLKKAFNLSDAELSIVIDSVLIIQGTIFPSSQYGPFARIAERLVRPKQKRETKSSNVKKKKQ